LTTDYLEELTVLQDALPAIPANEVSRIVAEELDEGLLLELSKEPIAAASIGQVHEAKLADGREVVVKVKRPGLHKQVTTDLEILFELADLVERHLPFLDYIHPKDLVTEFGRSLNSELNYRLEAVNIERFGRLYAGNHQVKIPSLHKPLCTSNILVMERISGLRIDEPESLEAAGISPADVAKLAAKVALEQAMHMGLFHADPHPGNIFVQPGPTLAFMDFGLVGSLDRVTRNNLLALAQGVVMGNYGRVVRAIVKLTVNEGIPDLEALEKEVGVFLEFHVASSLKDISLGRMLKDILELMSQNNLRTPPQLLLLIKAMAQFESLGLRLDPNFNIIEEAKPILEGIYKKRFSPSHWLEVINRQGLGVANVLEALPGDLSPLYQTIKTGRLPADLTIKDLDKLGQSINQASYRLAFALVLASLVIGSSVVMHSKLPPLWHGLPILGVIGFLGAGLVGFWLLLDFLKKKRQ
jgi:ubiquinone biosynthesis protein